MYIKINGTQYPCANYRDAPGVSASFVGVAGLTLPIIGVVALYADYGFEMARQNADSYARQVYENSVLTLTNEPEPEQEPIPDPEQQPDPIIVLQDENRVLKAQISAVSQSNALLEECIVEMAGIVYA